MTMCAGDRSASRKRTRTKCRRLADLPPFTQKLDALMCPLRTFGVGERVQSHTATATYHPFASHRPAPPGRSRAGLSCATTSWCTEDSALSRPGDLKINFAASRSRKAMTEGPERSPIDSRRSVRPRSRDAGSESVQLVVVLSACPWTPAPRPRHPAAPAPGRHPAGPALRRPGCEQPPHVCQVRHIRPRSNDGRTKLTNLRGWTITLKAGASVDVSEPVQPVVHFG
jgi:hypothetical protein